MFCSQCGHSLSGTPKRFCPACGASQGFQAETQAGGSTQGQRSSAMSKGITKKHIYIAGTVILSFVMFIVLKNLIFKSGGALNGVWETRPGYSGYRYQASIEFKGSKFVSRNYYPYLSQSAYDSSRQSFLSRGGSPQVAVPSCQRAEETRFATVINIGPDAVVMCETVKGSFSVTENNLILTCSCGQKRTLYFSKTESSIILNGLELIRR